MTENKKHICLSFDDGPNTDTMKNLLDVLEKHCVKASFFLIGKNITEESEKIVRRAFEMGCDIQNHSFSHFVMPELSDFQIVEEYEKTDELIKKITGKKAEFFRPPYIATSEKMFNLIKTPFICGFGCEDWEKSVSEDERFKRLYEGKKDGLIYLLHCMSGNEATTNAVDRLIPKLKSENYEFVNLVELFKITKTDPFVAKNQKKCWTSLI